MYNNNMVGVRKCSFVFQRQLLTGGTNNIKFRTFYKLRIQFKSIITNMATMRNYEIISGNFNVEYVLNKVKLKLSLCFS